MKAQLELFFNLDVAFVVDVCHLLSEKVQKIDSFLEVIYE
jgi:hypothetical protein